MEKIQSACDRLYAVLPIPFSLVNRDGEYLRSCPESYRGIVRREFAVLVLEDFKLQGGDVSHPLISYVDKGFFVAVVEPEPDLYILIGPVGSVRYSQKDLLAFGGAAILPEGLETFAKIHMSAPIVPLPQLKAYVCLMLRETARPHAAEEDIRLSVSVRTAPDSSAQIGNARFRQRESADPHAATDFERGVCDAIALGRSDLLVRQMNAAPGGSVGKMSPDPLRQRRYTFISFATLISRAAIRGGVMEETAFLLSDLYCQKMDNLKDVTAIDRLTVGMAMEFCETVARNRMPQQVSPVVKRALAYITVHLHEPFGMEDLADCCHLCRRSLTIRFQRELGMTVSEYVNREKAREAEFLLRHTDISLPEIAAYLNYSSQSYFTQQFKKLTGETPERYRVRRRGRQDAQGPAGLRDSMPAL